MRKTGAALFIIAAALLAADSPFVGTWKLNAAKSKFDPNGPSVKSVTVRIEADGANLKSTVDGVDGMGQPIKYSTSGSLDGKGGVVTGSTTIDTVTMQRVNDHTITAVAKKGGKTVYTDKRTVSKDGKTMTVNRSGMMPDGKPYQATIVVDKQ